MKAWYLSKTIWINILTAILGLLTVVAGYQWIPPELLAILTGVVVPIINVLLRWLTAKPITSVVKRLDKLRPGIVSNAQRVELQDDKIIDLTQRVSRLQRERDPGQQA